MISLGFEDSIILASDMADFRVWKNFGGEFGFRNHPNLKVVAHQSAMRNGEWMKIPQYKF